MIWEDEPVARSVMISGLPTREEADVPSSHAHEIDSPEQG